MSRISIVASACVLGALGCSPGAAPTPNASARTGAIDSMMPSLLEAHRTTGAAVALIEDGHITLSRGYGLAEAPNATPFTDSTIVNVASVSKSISAWGVLRLVRTGRVELAAPANRYLRRWNIGEPGSAGDAVTVAQLLDHTSGLSMAAVPSFPLDAPEPSAVDVLAGRAGGAGVHLELAPGDEWSYSGGGYTALQLLVEDVTAMPFTEYMQQRVFEALGLVDASYSAPVPGAAMALGHGEDGGPQPLVRYVGTAAAGLWISARDFGRMLRAYHEAWHGVDPVLGAATLAAVAANPASVRLEGVSGAHYGLGHGVHRTADGRLLLYHSGGNPGFRAYFIVEPQSGDGLFIAVNSDNGVPVIAAVRAAWGVDYSDLPQLY